MQKSKVGKVRIFNSKALYTASKPVFIVEGELDALSIIIDVGGEAVALGSTANRRAFINYAGEPETRPAAYYCYGQ